MIGGMVVVGGGCKTGAAGDANINPDGCDQAKFVWFNNNESDWILFNDSVDCLFGCAI